MLIVIGACVFLTIAFMGMAFAMERQSRRMSGRFSAVAAGLVDDDVPQAVCGTFKERVIAPILAKLNGVAVRMTPKASVATVNARIDRAGKPWGFNAATWTLLRSAAAVGAVGAGMIVMRTVPLSGPLRVCAGASICFGGLIGPSYLLDMKIKQRQLDMRRSLPDVIDLLVVSVEAGLGLDAAVTEVIRRRRGALLDEFARVLAEIRVGKSRRSAWQAMATRGDILELKVFVAALVQAEELGASIAGVLRGQADALRVRRSLMVREVAAMLPVKMLFPLIFFIFPGVFVVILGPGFISIVDTFSAIGF